MNTFELSRNFFNWSFENPDLVSPNHVAIYFFAIEHCNRLGGKEKFSLPSMMAAEAVGIKKVQTFSKYLNDLVKWGFIKMVQRSRNQYSANVICLMSATPENGTARDKANGKHRVKQEPGTGTGNSPIINSINKEIKESENNDDKRKRFVKPSTDQLIEYFKKIGLNGKSEKEAANFMNYYDKVGWLVGKAKLPMKDWEAAARGWKLREEEYNKPKNPSQKKEIVYPSK